jgi:hypothetical protein
VARTLVYHFAVTIPAGTTQAAPLVTPTTIEPNEVDRIEWLFPAGCNGLVGIQIGARAIAVLPLGGTTWFTRSGDSHAMPLTDMHVTGDWSVIGYNLGANPHTIEVTFIARRKEPEPEPFLLFTDSELSLFPAYGTGYDG